jgi:hypothetical protein
MSVSKKELGLLSKGNLVRENPSNFIGACLGEYEKKTPVNFESSLSCVLVIDEAYALNPSSGLYDGKDSYKELVVVSIVAAMQGVQRNDYCVIMLV